MAKSFKMKIQLKYIVLAIVLLYSFNLNAQTIEKEEISIIDPVRTQYDILLPGQTGYSGETNTTLRQQPLSLIGQNLQKTGSDALIHVGGYYSGQSNAVAYSNSRVFLADGGYVRILNVSDPENPVEITKIKPGYGTVESLACRGNLLFVGSRIFEIYDISDMSNPRQLLFDGPYGNVRDIDLTENLCIVTWIGCYNGIKLYDISIPSVPLFLSAYSLNRMPYDSFIEGNLLYSLKCTTSGFEIFDISDPYQISSIINYNTESFKPSSMIIKNNYAYLASHWYPGIRIIDISDPANPDSVGTFVDENIKNNNIFLIDNTIITANWFGIKFFDITDPLHPSQISEFENYHIAVEGLVRNENNIYFTDQYSGLRILDISDISNPVKVGTFETYDRTMSTAVNGDYIFLSSGRAGLRVIDFSDPLSPVDIWDSKESLDIMSLGHIEISGSYLYTGNRYIFDISNPENPEKAGNIGRGYYGTISIEGNYAYFLGQEELDDVHKSCFSVFDISDKTNPVLLSRTVLTSDYYENCDIFASGNYVCIINAEGVKIFDVSDKTNPHETASIPLGDSFSSHGISVEGDYLYIANEKFIIYDISDPANPVLCSSNNVDINKVRVSNGYAFCGMSASSDYTLFIYDVRDPYNPVLVDKHSNEMHGVFDINLSGSRIFTANKDGFSMFINKNAILFGDTKVDGTVDIFDLNETVNYILYGEPINPSNFSKTNTDVFPGANFPNYSGPWDINVFDVVSIVNTILGTGKPASGSAAGSSEITIGFENPTKEGGTTSYPIKLTGGTGIAGLEIHLEFDRSLTFEKPNFSQVLKDMNVSYSATGSEITILAYNMSNNGLSGYDDVILELPFKFSGSVPLHPVKMTSALAAGRNNSELKVNINNDLSPVDNNVPEKYSLGQNYPNPFNPETTIKYNIAEQGIVTITIYNTLGQKVKTLMNRTQTQGVYSAKWNGTNAYGQKVNSGIYFYTLKSGSFTETKKMLLLK